MIGERIFGVQPNRSWSFRVSSTSAVLRRLMLAPLALVLALASAPHRPVADSVRSDRDVRLAALRHVADVKRCYEREGLSRDPRLTGTLDVSVTVLATGEVSEATVASHTMRGLGVREVAPCLTLAIRNWRFERGPYAVETIVFPFRFTPIPVEERRTIVGVSLAPCHPERTAVSRGIYWNIFVAGLATMSSHNRSLDSAASRLRSG